MSTTEPHITLNLYGRNVEQWKIFIFEKLMRSPKWPAEVQIVGPNRSEGCILTFEYKPSSDPPCPDSPVEVSSSWKSDQTREELGWYEQLKMLWKGNMIEPRWDVETQKRSKGEREFMVKKYEFNPPEEVRDPMALAGWEERLLEVDKPSAWEVTTAVITTVVTGKEVITEGFNTGVAPRVRMGISQLSQMWEQGFGN